MQRRVPDAGKLKHLTGWEPQIPLDETLRQVIAYYRANRSIAADAAKA